MVPLEPLNDAEEMLWRSLMRLTVTLPRALGDIEGSEGLTGAKYALLMHLSEAPDRELTMSDLAERMAFSPGRITRMVAEMVDVGKVERRQSHEDGRITLAQLTDDGFATVVQMHPIVLASVRRLVFDHLSEHETRSVGRVLGRLAGVVDARRLRPGRNRRADAAR